MRDDRVTERLHPLELPQHISHSKQVLQYIDTPMTALKTDVECVCGPGAGVELGLGAALQGSSPSS